VWSPTMSSTSARKFDPPPETKIPTRFVTHSDPV
jgi:hypothetical protein